MFKRKRKAPAAPARPVQAFYRPEANAPFWAQGMDILSEAHTLIAGSTGCGKSTLIHKLMWTALSATPAEKQFIIIDMKMGVEMKRYRHLPHVLRFAQTGEEAIKALDYAMAITLARLEQMNTGGAVMFQGSDVYVVIDELGFLLQECGNDALNRLTKLGRIARAARVHLLMASQDPSRKGCPSAIQVNCTCLIGMKCRDRVQSRQIIGMAGCENLPRHGSAYMVIGPDTFLLPVSMGDEAAYQKRINYWSNPANYMVYRTVAN